MTDLPTSSDNYGFKSNIAASNSPTLLAVIKRAIPYWPVLIIAIILAGLSSYVVLRYTKKVYKVHARVIVNDDDQEKSNSNLLRFQLDGSAVSNEIEKEVEILKSRILLKEVVVKNSYQIKFLKKGAVKDRDLYGEGAPLQLELLEPEQIPNTIKGPVSVEGNVIHFLGKKFPADSVVATNFGKIKWSIKKNARIPTELIVEIKPLRQSINDFKRSLTVLPISKQSSILDLEFIDTKPEKGIDALNSLLSVYSTNYVNFKRRIGENTLRFIDDRLLIISQELNNVENNLQSFKSKEGVIDLSTEGQMFLEQVRMIDQDLSKIDIQLNVLRDLKEYVLRRNADSTSIPATLGLEDPLLQSLLTQLFTIESELRRIEKLSGPKNLQANVLRDELSKLRPSILQSIDNLRSSLASNKTGLTRQLKIRETELKKIPQKERLLLDISRQQNIKNTIYTYLLQKREEAAIQSASVVPNSRVIEQPELSGIESPKPKIIILVCCLGFLILTVGFVYFREFANPRFLYKNQIEESVDLPIIGEFQLVEVGSGSSKILVTPEKRDVLNEQFRELRTNLSFLEREDKNSAQIILFTSSKSGEGKSFVSINLASSLTQAGKKVVLLDLDLRRPKILDYLGLPKHKGVTSYLVNSAKKEDIIYRSQGSQTFDVIGSGPLPPNPSELLMTKKLENLIEELRLVYDYILIDSPPVGIVSDARLLGKFADLCLYLVRYDYTERSHSNIIRKVKESGGLPRIYIVFNAVPQQKLDRYDARYGYGYGYVEEKKKTTLLQRVYELFKF